ncbi:MAG: hypothetical protein GY853_13435 [PVC group bacterium]|nr:hypothetical protein [PVC group bacterium]
MTFLYNGALPHRGQALKGWAERSIPGMPISYFAPRRVGGQPVSIGIDRRLVVARKQDDEMLELITIITGSGILN